MPIFMDRHDVSADVNAEHVAQLHTEDLKIQHLFGCKGMTYWFDGERKTAFCLIEAPNKEAIQKMHDQAHGDVPHMIIEVDSAVVESFLGRIEDPKKSQNTELNIINDPAFRTIVLIKLEKLSLKFSGFDTRTKALQYSGNSIVNTISNFKGRIVNQKPDYFLISFDSVTNAVSCAIEIKTNLEQGLVNEMEGILKVKIGLNAGVPVTEKGGLFEDTIRLSDRLCDVSNDQIVVSSEVKDLFESENLNVSINKELVHTFSPNDEYFLNALMDYTESEWSNTSLNITEFSKKLGYSKSQLYRKMIATTGKSPNKFIKDYRMHKALKLLNKQSGNISEIAFETGFNSPAYFSKCFQESFGILPSKYIQPRSA